MMNFRNLLAIVGFLTMSTSFAQINADFELGDFTGWQGQTGYCCPISTTGGTITTERHTIMTGTATDPNTCDNVTVVAPGGTYSARLGNMYTGAEAEKLRYSVTVSPNSSLFIYKYAVVLEDPGHDLPEQPRFQITVVNAAGQLIDPVCGEYTVVASSDLPGFETCNGSIRYKDWTTVGLDLSPYIGQTLTIEFATGDCSQGAHFGYAYVDAYSSPLEINASYCSGSFSAMLTAPIGFEYLWNTGETTQSILVNDPALGLTYTCLMTSVTGCTVNISTVLELADPNADFTIVNTCFNNAEFTNTTDNPGNVLLDGFLWDFGDGSTSTIENPTHVYAGVGTYNVTFTIFNALGCTSTTSHPVTVVQPPTAAITYGSAMVCSTDGPQAVTLTGTHAYLGGSFESETGLVINAVTGEIDPLASVAGPYEVRYIVPTIDNCTIDAAVFNITISTQPTASISYGAADYCSSVTTTMPINLTGTGIYTGGVFSATPAGLNLNSANGSVNPSLSAGGLYTITYVVPSGGGCAAVPVTTTLTINTKPTAVITYGGAPYCDNNTALETPALAGTGNFTGGVFSAVPALIIDPATGAVTPSLNLPGIYTITYMIPAGGGCPGLPVTTTLKITELPTATISYAGPFCHSVTTPQAVIRTGTAAFTGGTYTSGPGLTINASTGAITPSASVPDTYTVTYTIPATSGCVAIPVQTSVTILPLPEPSLMDAVICSNPAGIVFRNALLDSGLPNNGYDFAWSLNNVLIPGANNNTYTAVAAGNYSLVVTNSLTGCSAAPVFANVSEAESVEDFIASISETFTDNNMLTVLVSGGTGPFLFQIDGQGFDTGNTFQDLSPGTHTIAVTDINGCTDVSKEIIVFGFPKYFTPNGDGANDFWNMFYLNQQDARIFIYDRYGKLLKQIGPLGIGWDGTFNGHNMPAADYWFVVEFKEIDKTGQLVPRQYRAHFTLKR